MRFKNLIDHLEARPGIYMMMAKGRPIYIGKAKNLKNRLKQYFQGKAPSHRISVMLSLVDDVQVTITENEAEALILENSLIKKHQPSYNILLKDDKTFPYLFFSEHDFPSLMVRKAKQAIPGRSFGPYPHQHQAKISLDQVQRVFRIRNCSDHFFRNRSRPCIQFEIKRCSAPCVKMITPSDYMKDIKAAKKLLGGQGGSFHQDMIHRMYAYAEEEEFERAAAVRDLLQSVSGKKQNARSVLSHAHLFYFETVGSQIYVVRLEIMNEKVTYVDYDRIDINDRLVGDAMAESYVYDYYTKFTAPKHVLLPLDDLEGLQGALSNIKFVALNEKKHSVWLQLAKQNLNAHRQQLADAAFQWTWFWSKLESYLDQKVSQIICIDISHNQGQATYASCVVCLPSGMEKRQYRAYKLSTQGDDYLAIEQAMMKKIKSGSIDEHTLVLIDGGKGQLSSAYKACSDSEFNCILTSIAKGPERIWGKEEFFRWIDNKAVQFKWPEETLQYLLHIRDQAHQFAVTQHRRALRKQSTQSILNQIEGIGDAKKKVILGFFGGLDQVRAAKLSEIEQVPGIGQALAKKIYDALHPE